MSADDFTNTDGTQIDVHDSNWTAGFNSQALSNATIQSNALQITAFRNVYLYYDGSQTDVAEVVVLSDGTSKQDAGPSIRKNATQYGYDLSFGSVTGTDYVFLTLYRNGVFLTQSAGIWPFASNHKIKLIGTVNGATLDLAGYVNDTLELSTNDATPLTGGFDGLSVDGRSIATSLDDWADGGSGGGGGLLLPVAANYYKQQAA